MTFDDAERIFATAKVPANGKPLCNNTRLYQRDPDTYAIRLHSTDVVTIHRDGRVTLNTGGWETVTTKDRINGYANVRVGSEKGTWYVWPGRCPVKYPDFPRDIEHDSPEWTEAWETYQRATGEASAASREWWRTNRLLFFDGITFDTEGNCLNGPNPEDVRAYEELVAERKKMIARYVTKVHRELHKGMSADTSGDCWYCMMREVETNDPWGDSIGVHDHLLAHLEELYVMPSLLVNAMREKGYQDVGIGIWLGYDPDAGTFGGERYRGGADAVGRAVRDYFKKRVIPNPPRPEDNWQINDTRKVNA